MVELFKLAANNLQKNKKQSIVVVIAIVLVCMLLFLASMAASIYRETLIQEALEHGDFHAILVNSPYDSLSILENNSQIESIKVIEELSTYKIEKEFQDDYVYIRGINIPFEEYITLLSGRLPENDHEIIIYFPAEYSGIKIGDVLNGFTVVGYYNSSNFDRKRSFDDNTLYAYTYKEVSNPKNASFIINLKSTNNAYKKIDLIAKEINSNSVTYNENLLKAYGQFSSYTVKKTYNSFLYFFLIIISIFSGFIIYNAFNISLNERKKQLGILRSIGASKKQLYILSMFEMLIISMISIPISLCISIGLAYLIVIVVNNLLSGIVSSLPFYIHFPYIMLSLLFIIITIFISASIPSIVSSNTSPLNLIRNTKIKKVKKVKEDRPLIRKLFGEEGEIAYKNRKRNSAKFRGPIVVLTLSLILFISVSAYINYLKLNINIDLPNLPDFHISLEKSEVTNPREIANYIKNMNYIDNYIEYKTQRTYIKVDNSFVDEESYDSDYSIAVYALDDENFKKYQKSIGSNSEVIFYNTHQYYDQTSNTKKYDNILQENTKNITLIKKGIENNNIDLFYLNNIFVTNDNYLNTFYGAGIVMSLSHYEKDYEILPFLDYGKDYNEIIKNSINVDLYSKKYRKLNMELSKYIDNLDDNDVFCESNVVDYHGLILFYNLVITGLFSIIGFIGLISALSIFNSITANMNLRSREFSMLRSIGLSHKGLLKVVNLESTFLIFTPLLYGLPISYVLVHFLMSLSQTNKFDGKVYMPFPTMYTLIAVVALIVLVLITMLYNYNKLKKKNIIDAVREEI